MKPVKKDLVKILEEFPQGDVLQNLKGGEFRDNSRLYQPAKKVIQRQKEIYRSLQESDKKLRLTLEVGKMGTWDWEIQTNKFTWSDGFKPLYGPYKGNIGGTLEKFLDHIHLVDRSRVFRNLKKAVKRKGEYEDEFRIVWPDGSIHWMLKKGRVIKNSNEKAERLIGIGMDITERKVSELILKQSEKKFKSIFDTSLDSILVLDDHMQIIEVNEATRNLYLYPRSEFRRKNFLSTLTSETRNEFSSQWKQFLKRGIKHGELEIIRKDGKIVEAEYSAKAQFLPNRNFIILRDITTRREEERRREHMLGIASHELRTPLASIKAFVEILKRNFSNTNSANISYYLSKIDDKAETLSQLINDLLDMTRIREGKLEIYCEMFDFDKLLDEIINDIALVNKSSRIIKKGKLERDIIADRNRIAQVIINIIKNAIKYSSDKDTILIKVNKTDTDIILSIQDFGIGIPKADQRKIFEIFYRVENKSRKRVNGLGVGLFISAEIVKKHGGRIWVESIPEKGSTFFILLPLIPKTRRRLPS